MTELIRRKFNWSSLNKLEQLALASSVLIWIGVVLFGGGLYFAMRNRHFDRQAMAQATAIVEGQVPLASPSPTAELFPIGWATATPTQTPLPTATPTPTSTPARAPGVSSGTNSTATPAPSSPEVTAVQPVSAEIESKEPTPPPPATTPPERIVIPAIELDSEIVPIGWYVVEQDAQRFSVWQVADYAVSWHQTSAYPGHNGNVVLNGHHNIKGEVFRYLVDLEVGDRVILYSGEQPYYYQVEQKMILKEKGESAEVRRENAQWIAPTDDERLTMVTCWPYTNNTHRLVVVARPAPPPPSEGLIE